MATLSHRKVYNFTKMYFKTKKFLTDETFYINKGYEVSI